MRSSTISPQLTNVLEESEKLTENEPLLLARLHLDSLLSNSVLEVYDEWRKHYGVSEE